jgi:TolA protein
VSLIAHLVLILMFVSAPMLEKLGILKRKPLIDNVYQTFIQVDVVALPDLLPGQKQSMDTSLPIVDKPAAEPEPAKEEKSAEDKKDDVMTSQEAEKEAAKAKAEAKKKKEAAEKEKEKEKEKKRQAEQEKALKKLEEEAKREAAIKSLQSKAGKKGRQKLAGNVLSKGTSLTGAVGTAKDQYTGRIVDAIKEHFNIYLWTQKKGLLAVLRLEFFSNGKVKNRQIIKKSSDPTYDSAVLQAVDAATFPVPEDPAILNEIFDITFSP